jgi:hypothetical protein
VHSRTYPAGHNSQSPVETVYAVSQGCLCCTVGDLHGHDVYGKYRMRSVTSGGAITFFVSASDETTTKEERSLPTLLIAGR